MSDTSAWNHGKRYLIMALLVIAAVTGFVLLPFIRAVMLAVIAGWVSANVTYRLEENGYSTQVGAVAVVLAILLWIICAVSNLTWWQIILTFVIGIKVYWDEL